MASSKVTINCETGEVVEEPLTEDEIDRYKREAQEVESNLREVESTKLKDLVLMVNMPTIRSSKEHREAFARLLGVHLKDIPVDQDATVEDIA